MEFNRILAACVVVTVAAWALERGIKQAAEKNRQREEYQVYENAGGLLLTIVIALIVLLFVWRAVYPEYLNGKNSLFFYAIGVCAIVNLVREIFLFFTMRITVTAMEISYRDRSGRIQTTGISGLHVTESAGGRSKPGKIEVFDREGRRLFWIRSNLVNAEYFVKDMESRKIRRNADGIWNG